jgi:hypothetical protein
MSVAAAGFNRRSRCVVLEFVDQAGRRYNPNLTIYEQPWWSVPAAVP